MPHVTTFAPGRVELLGNHTDYNKGLVLSAALPQGISVTGTRREDFLIRLTTLLSGTRSTIDRCLDKLERLGHWSDYPASIFETLQQEGISLSGIEATFTSTLPSGAGLSSSAALEVATLLLLQHLFPFERTGMELAKLCRRAENDFVGVNCGLLDQVSCLFGKRHHALFFDARSEKITPLPVTPNVQLLLISSGAPHALIGGEYNERREQCFAAARVLGVKALRDVSLEQLHAHHSSLSHLEFHRALHIVGENARVSRACYFLSQNNMKGLGHLLYESHESSRLYFENSTPELDRLVSLAKQTEGVYGARLTGGGFGGAIVVLVERSFAERAGTKIIDYYQQQTGHQTSFLVADFADGALAYREKENFS